MLDIALVGEDTSRKRVTLVLAAGKPLILKAPRPVVFEGNPPTAKVEFPINATTLAAAAGVDLTAGDHADKKWEMAESAKDGEYRFVARVPRDRRESFDKAYHVSEPAPWHVAKKTLRVLLFASAPTHDYQFLHPAGAREG